MTSTAFTRSFSLTTRVLLPVAVAVSTVIVAGPAHARPDAGTAAPVLGVAVPTTGCATAAADGARLLANLDRIHGSDYRVTIGCDPTLGITVQRGSFAGRVTENG